jgi:ABC-type transport system substrate-binding protein
MDRRTFVSTGTAAALMPIGLTSAKAATEKVLRLATTLSDIPLTTGQASEGAEGIRSIGLTLYEALYRWDLSQGERPAQLVPALAEGYTVDSETRTFWTFKLRQGVKFHDGSLFDADAVVWNLDKLLNPKAPQYDRGQVAIAGSAIEGLKSYRKLDQFTVQVETKQPDALFFYRVPGISMSSPARWAELGGDWTKFAEKPSGTGPWLMDKMVPRSRAELVRNPNYWNPARIAKLDRVILYMMPDSSARVAALLSGQVDWIEAPPPDALPRLKQAGMKIYTNVYPHIWPYFLSYTEDSPFRDIRVRKAANLAINRDDLVEFLGHTAKSARGMVDISSPWFGSPSFDVKYDPDQAKKLMTEAGYGPNKKCKIKLLTSKAGSGQMQPLPMNEFVQANLNDVGFEVQIEVIDWEALRVRRRDRADSTSNKGTHGLNNSWTTVDPEMGFLSVAWSQLMPPAGNNWGMYSDPKADEICLRIKAEFDVEAQNKIVAELHTYLVDQAMWIFVVHDLNPRALAPKVKGFIPPQSWYFDLTAIDLA